MIFKVLHLEQNCSNISYSYKYVGLYTNVSVSISLETREVFFSFSQDYLRINNVKTYFQEYVDQGNLRAWLLEPDAADQFRYNIYTKIAINLF